MSFPNNSTGSPVGVADANNAGSSLAVPTTIPGNSAGTNYLNSLVGRFLLRPKNAQGIGGFVFQVRGEESTQFRAEITDHWTEINTAVQDNIARRPALITLRGLVGELFFSQSSLIGTLATIQSRLQQVPAYLGSYTPAAVQSLSKALTQAQNAVNTVNQAVSKVGNVVSFFNPSNALTKQQQAYYKLVSLFSVGQLFSVLTPWDYFPSVAMESMTVVQPEDTQSFSEFTVVCKVINIIGDAYNPNNFAGRAAQANAPQTPKGQVQGVEIPAANLSARAFGTAGALA